MTFKMATAILLTAATLVAVATGGDKVAKAVDDICKEQAFLRGLREHIQSKVRTGKAKIDTIRQQASKWQLAEAASADRTRTCTLRTLQLYATASITVEMAKQAALELTAAKAVNAISEQIGSLDAASKLSEAIATDSTNGHTSTNNVLNIKLSTAAGSGPVCDAVADASKIEPGTGAPNYNRAHELKLTKPDDLYKVLKTTTVSIGGLTTCANAPSGTTLRQAIGTCTANGVDEELTVTTHPGNKKAATGTTRIFKSEDDMTQCDTAVTPENTHQDKQELLALHVCRTLLQPAAEGPGPSELSGKTLKESQIALTALRTCVPELQKLRDASTGDTKQKLQAFTETLYGEEPRKFAENYISKLDAIHVPLRQADKTDSKPINQITTPEQQAAVLSNSEGERIKKELEAEKKNEATSKPIVSKNEEKCKGKPQGECKEKDGCEFKDGKCKLKEGVKAENDGKPTNTTGSNSIVINNTPH
uniref:Variant surface glycoprotein 763 n=1 Tax=Trypanosoma brucei TaxID=5691 RepID=M4SZ23_9TRYP|nr:variant surface glycoprotein 763 [Trypanosoma brucei]